MSDLECLARYPFGEPTGLGIHPHHSACQSLGGLTRIRPPHGDDAWLVTRHEDIRAVLADRRFSRAVAVARDEPRLAAVPLQTSVLSLDPPEHTSVRRLLAGALGFNGPRVAELRGTAQERCAHLIDGMIAQGAPADLAEHFAIPLTGEITCELLGVPFADRELFRDGLEALASTLPEEVVGPRISALYAYIDELCAAGRAEAGDDVLGELTRAREGDTRLSDDGFFTEVISDLLLAGYYNTSTQLLNAVYLLLTHPDQLRLLEHDPELMPRAVEELLRYAPFPAHVTFARYATEDVEIGGTHVRAGEAVLVALPAGNFDEAAFENPEKLDLTRSKNTHLSFGHGLHHCLGGPLVRMLFQTALSALLERLPDLRLAVPESELPWQDSLELRRLQQLPVTWRQPRP
ncbi:cytochrome P450 [Actinomadura vinacea]|uniref:Cytochrome P450 n=1 Tax=Actinomadura vinacea TaxID=115336 RepID=A0ABP5VUE1_9ACTN